MRTALFLAASLACGSEVVTHPALPPLVRNEHCEFYGCKTGRVVPDGSGGEACVPDAPELQQNPPCCYACPAP